MKKKTVVITGILCFAVWLAGQAIPKAETNVKPGQMMGFIYQKDGKTPMKNAQVTLTNWPQDKKNKEQKLSFKSNITDSKGDYRILDVIPGNYKVEVILNNKPYKISRIDFLVTIVSEKTNFISFSLREAKSPLALIIAGTAAATALGGNFFFPEREVSPTVR